MTTTALTALLTLLALAGCTSAPVHYYTLVPAAAGGPSPRRAAGQVEVRIARLPAPLDRTALVVRSSPTEMQVLENERWSAPLRDELRDALRLALDEDLNTPGTTPVAPVAPSRLEVVVRVDRLEGALGRAVELDGSWSASVVPAAGAAPADSALTCAWHAVRPVGHGYAPLVAGYQTQIRDWADAIVASLHSGACP